ncbi:MAG: polysaccharide pyruvyl transferase family protein [Eubacterium sp.]|nr:polysaccharide pyruvyl transferase family protein [Eubacterium sp.]
MNRIVAFDTSLVSENGGDNIILDYCNEILGELFPEDFIIHIPTHDKIGNFGKQYCTQARYKIMCGTNILASRMPRFKMWDANILDLKYIKGTCLLGTGWREYEGEPNAYSRYFWKKALHREMIHSVRDGYTEEKLRKLGFNNVLNTSCPTMWKLTPEHCKEIPRKKANRVVTTLTNYRMNPEEDVKMLEMVCRNYEEVYIWIQALEDYNYLKQIFDVNRLKIVNPMLKNLDEVLQLEDMEYCGSRLHAGIRALNYKKRVTILAKDNRALEIGKDTGLNVVKSSEVQLAEDIINGEIETNLSIPFENIEKWKKQFICKEKV